MTEQEAIQMLERLLDSDPWEDYGLSDKAKQALQMGVDAMKKQIPKKPKVLIDTWTCPVCRRNVEYQVMLGENILFNGHYDYCPQCGQPIDWSGENYDT